MAKRTRNAKRKGKESIDPMMLPPRERIQPEREPEQGPRWLHFIAGFVVGFFVGGACSKFLWRRFGIVPMNTMALFSLAFAVAGAVFRGKLWRWMKL